MLSTTVRRNAVKSITLRNYALLTSNFRIAHTSPLHQLPCVDILSRSIGSSSSDDSKKDNKNPKKESMVISAAKTAGSYTLHFVRHPISSSKKMWVTVKDVAHHYYIGSKLLWSEIKMARKIVGRVLSGHAMTRRERLQLIRTTLDIFRVVPLTVFVLVPFMEFLLPFALKVFPNLLPSTFQDSLKKEEAMKKELQLRLEIADFFRETLTEAAKKRKKKTTSKKDENDKEKAAVTKEECGATEILDFIDRAKGGDSLNSEQVIQMASFFEDDLTLQNIGRPQLVSMCRYMGLPPFGADGFLRFQLRAKLRSIKEDDRSILWEGIDELTIDEVREACQERGMRATGLSNYTYKRQLKDWLDLSMEKNVPIALLVLSRAFSITNSPTKDSDAVDIKSSISSLDEEVLNEVVLAAARKEEEETVEIKQRRLESLEFQQEMIEDELEEKVAEVESKKKLKEKSKEKEEQVEEVIEAPMISEVTGDRLVVSDDSSKSTLSKANAKGQTAAPVHSTTDSTVEVAVVEDVSGTTIDDKDTEMPAEEEVEEQEIEELTLVEMEALGDLVRESVVEREKMKLSQIKAMIDEGRDIDETKEALDKLLMEEPQINLSKLDSELQDIIGGLQSARESRLREQRAQAEKMVAADDAHETPMSVKLAEDQLKNKDTEEEDEDINEDDEKDDPSIGRMRSVLDNMLVKLESDIEKVGEQLNDKLQLIDLDKDGIITTDELREAILKILKKHPSESQIAELAKEIDSDGDGFIQVEELLSWIEEKKLEAKMEGKKSADSEVIPSKQFVGKSSSGSDVENNQ